MFDEPHLIARGSLPLVVELLHRPPGRFVRRPPEVANERRVAHERSSTEALGREPGVIEARIIARQCLLGAIARAHQGTRDAFKKYTLERPLAGVVELLRGDE